MFNFRCQYILARRHSCFNLTIWPQMKSDLSSKWARLVLKLTNLTNFGSKSDRKHSEHSTLYSYRFYFYHFTHIFFLIKAITMLMRFLFTASSMQHRCTCTLYYNWCKLKFKMWFCLKEFCDKITSTIKQANQILIHDFLKWEEVQVSSFHSF